MEATSAGLGIVTCKNLASHGCGRQGLRTRILCGFGYNQFLSTVGCSGLDSQGLATILGPFPPTFCFFSARRFI